VTSPRPVGPVFVVIPSFNEAARLPRVLGALKDVELDAEVCVVDDGSLDRTAEVAAEHGATVLRHPFNLGYGAALQTGYKYAYQHGAALVLQMDADGQHKPGLFPELMRPILEGRADLVVGSRFLEPTQYRMGRIRTFGRLLFQRFARLCGLRTTDPTSGFQALNRAVLELYCRDFFPRDYPDVDVLLVAHKRGLRIAEIPVEMLPEERASTLHGGLKSIYYVYRLALSLWAGAPKERKES